MTGMNTIPILYNGGAYGTFMEWCLFYFAGYDIVSDPTERNGSSHGYEGTLLANIYVWEKCVKNQKNQSCKKSTNKLGFLQKVEKSNKQTSEKALIQH